MSISKKTIAALLAGASLLSYGCEKTEKAQRTKKPLTDVVSQSKPDKIKSLDKEILSSLAGKTVAVVLGYGYNTAETVEKIRLSLEKNYGLSTESEDGLVSLFVYPNDFQVSGKARVSKLTELVEDKTLVGMIILGAPEGTYSALVKIEDSTESGKTDYPIISLFPQDDNVLGTESTATFVLDYGQKANPVESEVTDFIPNFDSEQLLNSTIQSLITMKEPLTKDSNLLAFAQSILGKNRVVHHYVDSETNLQAINHFVFE